MTKEKKSEYRILAPSIICTIFTLLATESIFNHHGLNDFLFVKSTPVTLKQFNDVVYPEFFTSLNKKNLRQASYTLLKPILRIKDDKVYETLLNHNYSLKKYIKKFKFIYREYFVSEVTAPEILPTDKELNKIAIETLFLLVGI